MEHIIVLNDTMIDKQSFRWKIGVNQPPSFLLKRVHPVKDFFEWMYYDPRATQVAYVSFGEESTVILHEPLIPIDSFIDIAIEKGADINWHNSHAVRTAAEYDNLIILKRLVNCGADIHAQKDYALRYACQYGHHDIVAYLLSVGADKTAYENQAIRWATENGYQSIVKLLT